MKKDDAKRLFRIRETMEFIEEWHGGPWTLRIYQTRRPGTMGRQFAAILWEDGAPDPFVSGITGGAGYNKEAAAACEAFVKAKHPSEAALIEEGSFYAVFKDLPGFYHAQG